MIILTKKWLNSWRLLKMQFNPAKIGNTKHAQGVYKPVNPQKCKSQIPSYPYRDWETDRKSTRLNSSHLKLSRMPSSA